jgi:hypothetical protein
MACSKLNKFDKIFKKSCLVTNVQNTEYMILGWNTAQELKGI